MDLCDRGCEVMSHNERLTSEPEQRARGHWEAALQGTPVLVHVKELVKLHTNVMENHCGADEEPINKVL